MKTLAAVMITSIAVGLPLAAHVERVIPTNDGGTYNSSTASAQQMIAKTTVAPSDHVSGAVSSVKHRGTADLMAPPESLTLLLLGTGLIATGILVRRVAT